MNRKHWLLITSLLLTQASNAYASDREAIKGDFALSLGDASAQTAVFDEALSSGFRDALKAGEFSISLQLYSGMLESGDQWQDILTKDSTFSLKRNSTDNRLLFEIVQSDSEGVFSRKYISSSNHVLKQGQWTAVTLVCRNYCEETEIYFDGVKESLDPIDGVTRIGPAYLPESSIELGKGAQGFKGLVDELQFWSRPLEAGEVNWYASRKLSGSEVGLVGYWDFNHYYQEAEKLVIHEFSQQTESADKATKLSLSNIELMSGIELKEASAPQLAIHFDGVDDYIQMPKDQLTNLSENFAVEAWVRPDLTGRDMPIVVQNAKGYLSLEENEDYLKLDAGKWIPKHFTIETWVFPKSLESESMIFDFANSAGNNNLHLSMFPINDSENATLRFLMNGNCGDLLLNVFDGGSIEVEKWQHLAITVSDDGASGFSAKFYIDGEFIMSRVVKSQSRPSNSRCSESLDDYDWSSITYESNFVGHSNWEHEKRHDDLLIGDLKIWSHSKTKAQIQEGMHQSLSGSEEGLHLYLDFSNSIDGSFQNLAVSNSLLAGKKATAYGNPEIIASSPVFKMGLKADGKAYCVNGNQEAVTSEVLENDKWQHLTCSQAVDQGSSTAKITLLVDSTPQGEKGIANTALLAGSSSYSHSLVLGKTETGDFYKGWLDEFRTWSIPVDESQVASLSKTKISSDEPGLDGYWTFDEFSQQEAISATSDGQVAYLKNMTTNQTRSEGVLLNVGLPIGEASSPNPELKGLWKGVISVNRVNQLHAKASSEEVKKPAETPANFLLPILLHVDDNGEVNLLSEVTVMRDTQSGTSRYVLVTNPDKLSDYEGIIHRNGSMMGLRMSAPTFMLPFEDQNQLTVHPMHGGLGADGKIATQIQYDKSHPMHPFRHRYHPYLGRDKYGNQITRHIEIHFDGANTESVTHGESSLTGTYKESVTGLHKGVIISSGEIRLTRISQVSSLVE